MSLDPAFIADCPYLEEGILIDEILSVDTEDSRVVARLPTHADLPLTRTQRVHPTKHPRHVNGGLMVHLTGIVAFAHAYYVLDLRHSAGWTGYGAKIETARYKSMATVDAPIEIDCKALHIRRGAERVMVKYAFEFRQNEKTVYSSEQTAWFVRVLD